MKCHDLCMHKSDAEKKAKQQEIQRLQGLYAQNPQSQIFASLAEAYREFGDLTRAEAIAKEGVKRHQKFATGLVVLGRVLKDLQKFDEAEIYLLRAAELAPENLLAQQTLGELYLLMKKPKLALKAYKMLLLLKPTSQVARRAVTKLESLTADEYEGEMFAMTKLDPTKDWREIPPPKADSAQEKNSHLKLIHEESTALTPKPADLVPISPLPQPLTQASVQDRALERMLSLIDAFIVRNDLPRAFSLLKETQKEFGEHPELQKRFVLVTGRTKNESAPTPIKPLRPRQEVIREKKQKLLEAVLQRVEAYRDSHIQL